MDRDMEFCSALRFVDVFIDMFIEVLFMLVVSRRRCRRNFRVVGGILSGGVVRCRTSSRMSRFLDLLGTALFFEKRLSEDLSSTGNDNIFILSFARRSSLLDR